MLAFRHGHARADFRFLLVRLERLDVDELEQLHPVQPPLTVLDDASTVEIARLEGQLPADHPVADAGVLRDFDRPEMRQGSGLGLIRDRGLFAVSAIVFRWSRPWRTGSRAPAVR